MPAELWWELWMPKSSRDVGFAFPSRAFRNRPGTLRRAAGQIFTKAELHELRTVCSDPAFIEGCAAIRRYHLRNVATLAQRPSAEKRKYERWQRRYERPAPRGPRPPALTSLDVARLALLEPSARLWADGKAPQTDVRTAAAFAKLANLPRPTRLKDLGKHHAAWELRALFDHHRLSFTDYDSAEHAKRGAAARALRVLLGDQAPANMRNLIRSALKSPR